jgi:hypothetical protein
MLGRRSVMMRPTLSTALSIRRLMCWHLQRMHRACLRRLGFARLLLAQALVQPVHVHLQRHQQAAQFVVHLAGDAGALVSRTCSE